MISGPSHPLTRDGIWHLLRERADLFERGLRVVVEDLDLGGGSGVGDGLARDAAGAAVLVFVAVEGDPTLLPRIIAASSFVQRNGGALARALPEAEVRFGAPIRVFVIGHELGQTTVDALQRLAIPDLEILAVETFRLGGQERFVVRSQLSAREVLPGDAMRAAPRASLPAESLLRQEAPGTVLPATVAPIFASLTGLLQKLDPAVRIDGDRYSRRVRVHGRLLCDFWCSEDRVLAALPGATVRCVEDGAALRGFADLVMRRYLQIAAERDTAAADPLDPLARQEADARQEVGRASVFQQLRADLAATRLSREEYSALGSTVTEGSTPATG